MVDGEAVDTYLTSIDTINNYKLYAYDVNAMYPNVMKAYYPTSPFRRIGRRPQKKKIDIFLDFSENKVLILPTAGGVRLIYFLIFFFK